jgi:hypothetical protein
LQRNIYDHALLDIEIDGYRNSSLETGLLDGDSIAAHLKRAGNVFTFVIGDRLEVNAAFHVGDRDLGMGYDSSGSIFHGADDAAGILLSQCAAGEEQARQE